MFWLYQRPPGEGISKPFSALGWDEKGRAGARAVWEELDAVGAAHC